MKSFGNINLDLLKDTGWWTEINEGEENNIDSNTDEQKLESESLE